MPCSEYVCLVGACRNRVEDPLVPCEGCVTLFGSYLQPSGHEVSEETAAELEARSEAKAAAGVVTPVQRVGRPPRLSDEDLAEEAMHLTWCGVSREQAARQLRVSKPALEAAVQRARAAA